MLQTDVEQKRPRGNKTTATLSRAERDLRAYELTLNGCSVRGVCEELGIKSTQTAHNAILRGKKFALENGIDIEEHRIDIDRMFKQTLGLLVATAQQQHLEGQIETIHSPDGTIVKTKKGIDPRIAGELSRSLNRWAEFCGLLDRAPEVNQQANVIQLSAPADGASFTDRWSASETVDVAASESKSESTCTLMPAEASPALQAPTPSGGVTGTERVQPELF
ncbi:hypothetical protein [Synechococcus sp. UW179A]|uniref:hypothetical protein n=1 Tax=Synechococcus sp. UW179A TaxID=2575510 RepID=UPI000E0FA9E1|nr:hypothetical protein [Synechococcus sp. UW179A]